jgi:hypothetical protein
MKKLTRLWWAFERIPGLAAIQAHWRHHCGPEFPLIEPFLKATEIAGVTYPCGDCQTKGCAREIRDYGDGEIAAVCQNEWNPQPDIPLVIGDTIIRDLDVSAFSHAVARPLGIRWQQPVVRGHGAWAIGLSPGEYGVDRPVVLIIHSEQERFRISLSRLLADSLEKFILLSPTARHKDLGIHETLERRGIPFATLDSCLGVDANGRFISALPGPFPFSSAEELILPTLKAERPDKVAGFLSTYGVNIKDILTALNLDRRDFNRWRKGDLPDSSSKSKKIEVYLRSGPRQE